MKPSSERNNAPNLAYPRTGKRGVPQQFPRRLYEMLEAETNTRTSLMNGNQMREKRSIIEWSESGRAFRIADIQSFATHILPKYFRTSKFSSFQRNLNLVSQHKNIESFHILQSDSSTSSSVPLYYSMGSQR